MFIHRRLVFAAGFLVAAVVSAGAGETVAFDGVRAGLAAKRIVLVDVREADEFAAGHVPGAINRPLSTFSAAALPQPQGETVVLMCRSGHRAGQALAAVEASGRRDVDLYAGSMNDWVAKAGPVAIGE